VRIREYRFRRGHDWSAKGGEASLVLQARERSAPVLTECDVCGAGDLAEIRCKVICRNCRTILQSCADL
jgi:hypothetical protein